MPAVVGYCNQTASELDFTFSKAMVTKDHGFCELPTDFRQWIIHIIKSYVL